jgi:hypothetical protein
MFMAINVWAMALVLCFLLSFVFPSITSSSVLRRDAEEADMESLRNVGFKGAGMGASSVSKSEPRVPPGTHNEAHGQSPIEGRLP